MKENLKQAIPLKTVQNARELGGYLTTDGRQIQNGVLLRTAKLQDICEEEIHTLTDIYRLQHIIDFRMAVELPGAEDPVIEGVQYHHLDVIDSSTMTTGDMPDMNFNELAVEQMAKMALQSGMINENMYIGFLTSDYGRIAFAQFFRILLAAEPGRAVLWHCTSGKDRTGLAAMLLLSVLEVDESVIIEDYLLTNAYYARRIEGTRQLLKAKGCNEDFIDKAVLVFDAVDERFMWNAIAFLKKNYGSVKDYILDALAIKQEEINTLKDKYLSTRVSLPKKQ